MHTDSNSAGLAKMKIMSMIINPGKDPIGRHGSICQSLVLNLPCMAVTKFVNGIITDIYIHIYHAKLGVILQ